MRISSLLRSVGVIIFLVAGLHAMGQDASISQASQQAPTSSSTQPVSVAPTTLQTFQQAQQTLTQERQALVASGATQQQLAAWQQQNAGQFASLQQMATAMANASYLQQRPANQQPNIRANASPTLTAFLTTQASLANARAQIHNQLLQALPANASAARVSQMQQQELQTFQQQHAPDLQLQAQRAQTLAMESSQTPLPVPGPPMIPANASPQLAAFLTLKNQLAQSRIAVLNQNITADPSVRQAALQQWMQQNQAQLQQLQQLAQNLSQTN